jgi:hypothetical protein
MKKRILQASVVAMVLTAMPALGANHDKWVEARSPNFIVVSNAGEAQAWLAGVVSRRKR